MSKHTVSIVFISYAILNLAKVITRTARVIEIEYGMSDELSETCSLLETMLDELFKGMET